MTKKATRPCLVCGRRLAAHRGKRKACSKNCRDDLKRLRNWIQRRPGALSR